MSYKTEQEEFWSGEFGDNYIDRNSGDKNLSANIALFSEILRLTRNISSVIEFGSNIGLNLKALKTLKPEIMCGAIEINHWAVEILKSDMQLKGIKVHEKSILEYSKQTV